MNLKFAKKKKKKFFSPYQIVIKYFLRQYDGKKKEVTKGTFQVFVVVYFCYIFLFVDSQN